MKSARWICTLVAGAVIMTGCENTPLGLEETETNPAFAVGAGERIVLDYFYDLTGSAFSFACNEQGEPIDPELGELVYLEGGVLERVILRTDANGGNHYRLRVIPIGLKGVGETSGEPFRVIERERSVFHDTDLAGWGNYKSVQELVGKETGRTLRLVFAGSYYYNKDGSIERERYRERIECKPGM